MTPYCIAIIKLKEGPKIISQIADAQLKELKIGMPVQAVFRNYYCTGKKEIINYGLKFIPIEIQD